MGNQIVKCLSLDINKNGEPDVNELLKIAKENLENNLKKKREKSIKSKMKKLIK
jgi:hypothetical protein